MLCSKGEILYTVLLQIHSGNCLQKISILDLRLSKLLQNEQGCNFLPHSVQCSHVETSRDYLWKAVVQIPREQVAERPVGSCDMQPSRIITDYRLSKTKHFR